MSRQHFEMIAEVLREHRSSAIARGAEPAVLNAVAETFAGALEQTNPRFDRDRFLRAAGAKDPS